MKRLILTISAILCLASPAYAWMGVTMVGGGGGAAPANYYCSSGATCPDPPAECDMLCEDFEGASDCGNDAGGATNCRQAWSVTEAGEGNLINFSNTPTGTSPCDGTTSVYNVKVTQATDDSVGDAQATVNLASADQSSVYGQFYINFTSEGLGNGNAEFAFVIADSGLNRCIAFGLYQDSGLLYLRAYGVASQSSDAAVSLNTWYGIRFHFAQNAESAWSIDYDADGTFTDQTAVTGVDVAADLLKIGRLNSAKTISYEIDAISLDNDTIQKHCE